jgi:DNA helicase II / ATP-dependent DNA helicase PcrA
MTLDSSLNERQREAVCYVGGPLQIVAGAGTGKTRVIVHRLAHLIQDRSIPPERILAVTFTNRAADEMRTRVADLIGEPGKRIHVGTFHWLGHRILRRYGARLSVGAGFRVLTPSQAAAVLRQAAKEIGVTTAATPGDLREAVRAYRNVGALRAATVTERARGELSGAVQGRHVASPLSGGVDVPALTAAYVSQLRRNGALDLDDLILEAAAMLEAEPDIRSRLQNAFSDIVVDEYQDTNPPQTRLLQMLVGPQGNITVVGDDDQSIYGWRHADPRNMLDFSEVFPGTTIVRLEQNYRSTQRILRPADELLRHNRERLGKTLVSTLGAGHKPTIFAAGDESEEAMWFASTVASLLERGTMPDEVGVLLRVHAQSRLLEEALTKAGIAYEIRAGRRFYERPEVARLIDALRVLVEPDNTVAWSSLFRHVRGMGPARTSHLLASAEGSGTAVSSFMSGGQLPLPAVVRQTVHDLASGLLSIRGRFLAAHSDHEHGSRVGAALVAAQSAGSKDHLSPANPRNLDVPFPMGEDNLGSRVGAALVAVQSAGSKDHLSPANPRNLDVPFPMGEDNLGSVVRSVAELWEGVVGALGDTAADRESAVANIDEFISAAVQFSSTERGYLVEFLDRLALSEPSVERAGVQLMTLHSAKGLEFEAVFIPGVEEGLLPHRRSFAGAWQLEEERRLLYVGMTRARRRLYLSYARARLLAGAHSLTQPSRFLDDMPRSMFEVSYGPAKKPRDRLTHVSVGELVEHPRWGLGEVVAVEGHGRQTMVTMQFADGSRQRVQLCHAPLKRVG